MRHLLLYTSLILLISTAATSFGWYLACNKPCDPEYIMVKGDTVYLNPEPIASIVPDTSVKKPKGFRGSKVGKWLGFSQDIIYRISGERDNLYQASIKHGVTVAEIMAYNHMTSDIVHIGDEIKIPPKTAITDTVYTYQKDFGDSTVKGTIYTQSPCKIISQSVVWESLVKPPKNRIFCGVQIDNLRNLSGMGALELKSGWMVTGSVGVFGDKSYQVGVMKRLR